MAFVLVLLIAAAVLALRYGVDSRDGRDWAPTGDRAPQGPVVGCC